MDPFDKTALFVIAISGVIILFGITAVGLAAVAIRQRQRRRNRRRTRRRAPEAASPRV